LPTLLVYSVDGALTRATSLAPNLEIRKLEFDSQGNVWTLTMSSGDQSPDNAWMVIEYGPDGKIIKRLGARSEFPSDAAVLREGKEVGGEVSFGLSGDRIWFYLPDTHQLAIAGLSGPSFDRYSTSIPQPPMSMDAVQGPVVRQAALLNSGSLLAFFTFLGGDQNYGGTYIWRVSTGNWEAVSGPGVTRTDVVGVDGDTIVLCTAEPGGKTWQVVSESLPSTY
jgi:hypothetical protein